ncbi:unnamed protein product [Chrysoparadoxa australica]
MNAPERSECWRLNEDEKKITYQADTKIPNAGNFVLLKEDHTLGNLIRMQLLQDKQVRFAGYMQPHPLEHVIQLKVQTNGETTPLDSLSTAVEDLASEVDALVHSFQDAVETYRHQQEQNRG